MSMTTISSEYVGMDLPEGMYPGMLTVDLSGPIVIEEGGSLSIGTLSIGSTSEARPLLRGTLSEGGVIVVKAGGSLKLSCVDVEASGTGLLILQEPGSSVSITDAALDESWIQWAPPVVSNLYDEPEDIWLPEGTPLNEAQLPTSLRTNLQDQGSETRQDVALLWDMSGYDGRMTGEYALTGSFVDETGAPYASLRPLTLTVHWYRQDELPLTGFDWSGNEACTAYLSFTALPSPDAEILGEISTDGENWSTWTNFDVHSDDKGQWTGFFYEVSSTPQYYRLVAQDLTAGCFWTSDAVLLPQEEGEDQGGNRGGSTSVYPSDREPEPVPTFSLQPSLTPEPTPELAPSQTPHPTSSSASEETALSPSPTPSALAETPAPTADSLPSATPAPVQPSPATPVQTDSIAVSVHPSSPSALSPALQALLAGGGLAVCAAAGWAVYRFTRRKKK